MIFSWDDLNDFHGLWNVWVHHGQVGSVARGHGAQVGGWHHYYGDLATQQILSRQRESLLRRYMAMMKLQKMEERFMEDRQRRVAMQAVLLAEL